MGKVVNALRLRQQFGSVLEELRSAEEPIVIEKGKKPVAVLISMELYKERFIDFQDIEKQQQLLEEFKKSTVKSKLDSLSVLRELRYG